MQGKAKLLRVNEIFLSIKGEGVWEGNPMWFVRGAQCNLRCNHCDTAFNSPVMSMTVEQIILRLDLKHKIVVLTGGEFTLQDLGPLTTALHDQGYRIHLESNGTMPIRGSMDWICISPKLNEQGGIPLEENIALADEIKMPICKPSDLEQAEEFRAKAKTKKDVVWLLHPWNDLFEVTQFAVKLGPGARDMTGFNATLNAICVEYILRTAGWRISTQLHKLLGVR